MTAFHLSINQKDLKNSNFAILVGDPNRCQLLAQEFNQHIFIAYNREFCIYLAKYKNSYITIASTGIGGPSTAICIEELAMLGVKKFLRIGTTGAIASCVKVGDIIITEGSVRLDGTSLSYAPLSYPAVSDSLMNSKLSFNLDKLKLKHHLGITASTDSFYRGQERYDNYNKYILPKLKDSLKMWRNLNVLNFEMESSSLLTLARSMGLKAACITSVILNRFDTESKADITKLDLIIDNIKNIIEEIA